MLFVNHMTGIHSATPASRLAIRLTTEGLRPKMVASLTRLRYVATSVNPPAIYSAPAKRRNSGSMWLEKLMVRPAVAISTKTYSHNAVRSDGYLAVALSAARSVRKSLVGVPAGMGLAFYPKVQYVIGTLERSSGMVEIMHKLCIACQPDRRGIRYNRRQPMGFTTR